MNPYHILFLSFTQPQHHYSPIYTGGLPSYLRSHLLHTYLGGVIKLGFIQDSLIHSGFLDSFRIP
jgi:hypothetical protein